LPTGDLRDLRKSSHRADVILITKCSADISRGEKKELIEEINPLPHQQIFFTTIVYGTPFHITQQNFTFIDDQTEVLLITGVANPRPLKKFLEERINTYHMMHYSDHHIFSIDDWKEILNRFDQIQTYKKIILTTEKDAMRLLKFDNELHHLPLYVIPIEHRFLFNEGRMFDDTVINFIQNFKQPV
jgi:tetraacyldisaccharide 4'-kinase